MRRFLGEIALYVLVFLIAGIGLMLPAFFNDGYEDAMFGVPKAGGATNLRIPEFDSIRSHTKHLDYLFLGSSTCYRGIAPQVMFGDDTTCFNLGSSSQQIMNSEPLVDWALEELQVDHLIIDIHPEIWTLDGVEPARDHIRNNPLVAEKPFRRMAVKTADPYTLYMWVYFSLRQHVKPMEPMEAKRDEYQGLGFVYSNHPLPDSLHCVETYRNMELGWKDSRALEHIVNSIEAQGGQTILLVPPVKCLESFVIPEAFQKLPLIDGRECPIPDSLYYDENHLIGEGAYQYSRWVAEKLRALERVN